MPITRKEIAQAYLRLSSQGYAAGTEALSDDPELSHLGVPHGWKAFGFPYKDWFLLDAYRKGEGGRSAGLSILSHGDVDVFYFSYAGRVLIEPCDSLGIDPKDVTDFLKRALLASYADWEEGMDAFRGGRGPFNHREGLFVYRNSCSPCQIDSFSGREIILFQEKGFLTSTEVFFHNYQGQVLIDLP